MSTSVKPRAVVVGGSLSGLFTATSLRRAGWDVDVFELSSNELDSGGGIVLQPDVLAAFRFAGVALPERLGVESGNRIYLDRDNNVIEQFYMPQTQTSWNLLYTTMKQALPAESLHAGEAFTGFDIDGEQIVAHFATGRSERADLLIGADGARSSVRRVLLPDVAPNYAGYVAWCGLVPENVLPQQAADILRDRFTFQHGPAHSALAYLVPGEKTARPLRANAAGTGSGTANRHAMNSINCWSIVTASNARFRCRRARRKTRISTPCAPLRANCLHRHFKPWSPDARTVCAGHPGPACAPDGVRQSDPCLGGRTPCSCHAPYSRQHGQGSGQCASLASALASTSRTGAEIDDALERWERAQLQLGMRMTDLGVSTREPLDEHRK